MAKQSGPVVPYASGTTDLDNQLFQFERKRAQALRRGLIGQEALAPYGISVGARQMDPLEKAKIQESLLSQLTQLDVAAKYAESAGAKAKAEMDMEIFKASVGLVKSMQTAVTSQSGVRDVLMQEALALGKEYAEALPDPKIDASLQAKVDSMDPSDVARAEALYNSTTDHAQRYHLGRALATKNPELITPAMAEDWQAYEASVGQREYDAQAIKAKRDAKMKELAQSKEILGTGTVGRVMGEVTELLTEGDSDGAMDALQDAGEDIALDSEPLTPEEQQRARITETLTKLESSPEAPWIQAKMDMINSPQFQQWKEAKGYGDDTVALRELRREANWRLREQRRRDRAIRWYDRRGLKPPGAEEDAIRGLDSPVAAEADPSKGALAIGGNEGGVASSGDVRRAQAAPSVEAPQPETAAAEAPADAAAAATAAAPRGKLLGGIPEYLVGEDLSKKIRSSIADAVPGEPLRAVRESTADISKGLKSYGALGSLADQSPAAALGKTLMGYKAAGEEMLGPAFRGGELSKLNEWKKARDKALRDSLEEE